MSVLDIGSGSGGDILKYTNCGFQSIYLTDPDECRIKEAIARINGNQNIHTLVSTAENVCLNTAFDVVASFFVLSFMYDTEQHLDAFIDTVKRHIKIGGVFIGTMIDTFGQCYDREYCDGLKITAHNNTGTPYGNRTHIFMKQHLDQIEYETNYKELRRKMYDAGFIELESMRFGSREYLNDAENTFSKLFRYFAFKYVGVVCESTTTYKDMLQHVTRDTLCPDVALYIIRTYGVCLGLEQFVVDHIIGNDLKLYEIYELDMVKPIRLRGDIFTLFTELVRQNDVVQYRQVAYMAHKNIHLYTYTGNKIYEYNIGSMHQTVNLIIE